LHLIANLKLNLRLRPSSIKCIINYYSTSTTTTKHMMLFDNKKVIKTTTTAISCTVYAAVCTRCDALTSVILIIIKDKGPVIF